MGNEELARVGCGTEINATELEIEQQQRIEALEQLIYEIRDLAHKGNKKEVEGSDTPMYTSYYTAILHATYDMDYASTENGR